MLAFLLSYAYLNTYFLSKNPEKIWGKWGTGRARGAVPTLCSTLKCVWCLCVFMCVERVLETKNDQK